jgi:hexosaminidase
MKKWILFAACCWHVLTISAQTKTSVNAAALAVNPVHPGVNPVHSGMNPVPFVIPALREWVGGDGYFILGSTVTIVVDPASADSLMTTAGILQQDLAALTGVGTGGNRRLFIRIRKGVPGKGDIFLSKNNPDQSLGGEGYLLDMSRRQVRISAISQRGIFWGTRTLLQLLEQDSLHQRLPCGVARDYPKYAIRGFVLDDGRKFFSMDFLRQYVKFMAYYKMNDFHIHLNDNGFRKYFGNNWDSTYSAFRLECSNYPGLTAKDGSYSKKDFMELQELAASYGVTIIPEIDVPAHALAFTKMRPETGSRKYGMDHLDLDNPVTYQVIDSVFKEYLEGPHPVFMGREVHIGTDEYAKEASEQFRAFTEHYIELVERYGKKVRLWGALTHAQGKTPVKVKGVTMNVWYNGYANPKEMAALGYDIISTPDDWLYIVPAAGYYNDYLDLPAIYSKWEPRMVGDILFADGDPAIKGGSFAVWNDIVGNGITEKDVHDRVFPAMQVLSQKMWKGGDSTVSYQQFAFGAAGIGEGPGANMRGKIKGKDSLVLYYDFRDGVVKKMGKNALLVEDGVKNGGLVEALPKNDDGKNTSEVRELPEHGGRTVLRLKGGESYLKTALPEIGYDYTVSFRVRPDSGNLDNAVLFSSDNGVLKLNQGHTGKLGFSREGYDYIFDYHVPEGEWTSIAISGDHKETALYVNGKLVQRLSGEKMIFPGVKDTVMKVQTFFFPLQYIGDPVHAFKGLLDEVKVFNVRLSEAVVRGPNDVGDVAK